MKHTGYPMVGGEAVVAGSHTWFSGGTHEDAAGLLPLPRGACTTSPTSQMHGGVGSFMQLLNDLDTRDREYLPSKTKGLSKQAAKSSHQGGTARHTPALFAAKSSGKNTVL